MITEIAFTKASGAGNDFIIVDNRRDFLPANTALLAQRLCSRHFGIGADGLLLLELSQKAHFTMKYFNSDGTDGGMCGNGGRCIARFAWLNGIAPPEMFFEALDFTYEAHVLDERVSLKMKDPTDFRSGLKFPLCKIAEAFYVNTGSPHVVAFVDDVTKLAVESLGRLIRQDALFKPAGTNVNFVELTGDNSIRVRTYERGVEAETWACGTGAVASAIIAHLHRGVSLPTQVEVKSGELLVVRAKNENNRIRFPQLEGSAHMIFTARVFYDSQRQSIVMGFPEAEAEKHP
jgi:diaminopimelate epimerase